MTTSADTRDATVLAERSTEAARQKRLTADRLQAHEIDITDLRETT